MNAKQKLMAVLAGAMIELQEIDNLGIFIKAQTVAEAQERNDKTNMILEKIGKTGDKKFEDLVFVALVLLDKDGNPIYDAEDLEDLKSIESMPYVLYNRIFNEFLRVNSPDFLQKKMASAQETNSSLN